MQTLSHHEITTLLLSLGVLLAVARLLGELAQRLHQPAVAGEMLAGILLGPTVLGAMAPEWQKALFPSEGPVAIVFSGMTTLSITLFLLVAGMEVDLSSTWRQGAVAFKVGLLGMFIPFLVGFLAAIVAPRLMGGHADARPLIFALFFATALSISALPVIAKTLLDLDLYRSDLGMVIVSAAVFNDLVGWIVFALVLGMLGTTAGIQSSIGVTMALTLLFAAGMLTVGRWMIHRLLPYVQAYTHWPGGVLSLSLALALIGAAVTEWIGVHAIFGAFLVGVAIGDSAHLRERTRTTIDHFVSFIFAPLFFGSIGLRVNFTEHIHWPLVLTVLAIACAGKLLGCTLGARWGGLSPRDGWAVALGMNARGAMEIILGLLALQAGVIQMPLFIALVIMAIVTSMMSGPLLQLVLGRRKPRHVTEFLNAARFVRNLSGTTRDQVMRQLAQVAVQGTSIDPVAAADAVIAREETMHTGIGHGVAIPHARMESMTAPLVALGISEAGVDFDAPDGVPAHAIFLVLTPVDDNGAQLQIMASLARAFRDSSTIKKIQRAGSLTEILAILKAESQTTTDIQRIGDSMEAAR